MISTDDEHRRALQRLSEDAETLHRQRTALVEAGLSKEELNRAMAPLLSFRAGLEEEAEAYADARGGVDGVSGVPATPSALRSVRNGMRTAEPPRGPRG